MTTKRTRTTQSEKTTTAKRKPRPAVGRKKGNAVPPRMKALHVPVVVVDTNRIITFINQAAADLLGTTIEAAEGSAHAEIVKTETTGTAQCSLSGVLEKGESVDRDEVLKTHKGDIPVKYGASPLRDAAGRTNGAVESFIDISEIKKAEDVYFQLMDEASEKVFFLNSLPMPVSVIGLDFNICFINPAGAALVDKQPDELLGKKCSSIYKTRLCNTHECPAEQVFQRNETILGELVVDPEGRNKPFRFGATPVRGSKGDITGVLEYMVDITEEVQSLNRIHELVASATAGRLDNRANVAEFSGNFKKIVSGVNELLDAMMSPIQEANRVLRQSAQKDLMTAMEGSYLGDYQLIKDNLNNTLTSLREAIRQIGHSVKTQTEASEHLKSVSQLMSSNAKQTLEQTSVVSAASNQVNLNVEAVAAAMEEMRLSINEIAKNAVQAAMVANSAVKVAEATNETIAKLGESSAKIGQVIKVINNIAEQTNLLALNATIEAARAGDAGRGFAVVANEVKELAKETAKATGDISQRIEAIQVDTRSAVEAIAQVSTIIHQIDDISNVIASAVEEQTATASEIVGSVGEAAQGVLEITRNIGRVVNVAQSTSEGAEDTQLQAERMVSAADTLSQLISQFKV